MIFKYLDYRDFIKSLVEKKPSPYSYQSLAQAMRMQKSYLSRILGGAGQLSQDQGYHLSQHLKLNPTEKEYLELLIEWDRTGIQQRKRALRTKIQSIQKSKIQTSEFINKNIHEQTLTEYYYDPWMQILHIALLTEGWTPTNYKDIGHHLGLSEGRIQFLVEKLTSLNLIAIEQNRFVNKAQGLHLSSHHPLTSVTHSLFRTASAAKMQQLNNDDAYSFTATFSANEETFLALKTEFLNWLKSVEPLIDQAPSQECYQVHFDLFPWLKKKIS